MPEVIRHTAVLTAVVTISTVADQSTLNPVSPTVSATINGVAATITAWSWKVNGATTGITGATTATPTYTPTTGGSKSITCDVTIGGVVYTSTPETFVVGPTAFSIAITAIDDMNGLETVNLVATPTGGVTPITYAWAVIAPDESSQTAVVANAAAASTTAALASSTGRKAGLWTFRCTATDAVGQVWPALAFAAVGKEVDTGAGSIWMYLASTVDFTGEATADWTAADGAHVIDGVSFLTANGANAATLGPSLGVGIDIGPDNNVQTNATVRTGPRITTLIQSLISGWTFGTPFCIQWIFNVLTELTVAGDAVRCWVGTMVASDVTDNQMEAIAYRIYAATGGPGVNFSPNSNQGAAGGAYYNDPGVQPDSAMELLVVGNSVFFGYAASDPGAAAPAPGSMTRSLVSSTASDYGPIAWTTRPVASTLTPVDADCVCGFAVNRVNTGTARAALEYMHAWVAA